MARHILLYYLHNCHAQRMMRFGSEASASAEWMHSYSTFLQTTDNYYFVNDEKGEKKNRMRRCELALKFCFSQLKHVWTNAWWKMIVDRVFICAPRQSHVPCTYLYFNEDTERAAAVATTTILYGIHLCIRSRLARTSTHTHTNEIRSTLYVNLKIRMLSCFGEVGLLQKLLRRATVYNRPSSI